MREEGCGGREECRDDSVEGLEVEHAERRMYEGTWTWKWSRAKVTQFFNFPLLVILISWAVEDPPSRSESDMRDGERLEQMANSD